MRTLLFYFVLFTGILFVPTTSASLLESSNDLMTTKNTTIEPLNTTESLESLKLSLKSYEKGWRDGHCKGWRDVLGSMVNCPIAPLTPIPKMDCREGYTCGYNRGFLRGREDAKKWKAKLKK